MELGPILAILQLLSGGHNNGVGKVMRIAVAIVVTEECMQSEHE